MELLISSLLLFSCLLGQPAHAMSQAGAYKAEFDFNHGQNWQGNQAGTKIIRDTVHDAVAQYDFAIDGGAISTITLRMPKSKGGVQGPKQILPKGAIVVGCYIDVITPGTTSASGTMSIGTGQATNDLKSGLAAASYTGIVACVPTGSAATSIKLTADSTMTATIATGAFTAGKWNIHVQYLLSDE